MKRSAISLLLTLVAVLGLLAAACGDDDDDTSGSSTSDSSSSDDGGSASSDGGGKAVSDATSEELEKWQTDLNAVGCYAGAVDGSLGPQTESAIRAFQTAKGLTIDGLLGPETEGALTDAVAAGEIVCTSESSGAPEGAAQVSLASDSYGPKDFTLGTCSLDPDISNVYLAGESDGITIEVEVVEGTGTLAVSGGTESDGIILNGNVGAMTAGADRSFNGSGEFIEPNFVGEAFTLSGACPDAGE